jgi:glycerophosphoryl diester phosphodiesterase
MKLLLLFVFVWSVYCFPTNATYATAQDRPLNIGHRGLCSLLPENTLEAFEAALYQGADFFELDVVYTK